jgi:hypothetical protein
MNRRQAPDCWRRRQKSPFSLFFVFFLLVCPCWALDEDDLKDPGAQAAQASQLVSFPSYPGVVLEEPEGLHKVLEAHGMTMRFPKHYPLGLAAGEIFLDFAMRGAEEEDVTAFWRGLEVQDEHSTALYRLAFEAKVNADVLLADAKTPDAGNLKAGLGELGDYVLRGRVVDARAAGMSALAAVLYRFPGQKVANLCRALDIPEAAFVSQTGVSIRFLDTVYRMQWPRSMKVKDVEQYPPLVALPPEVREKKEAKKPRVRQRTVLPEISEEDMESELKAAAVVDGIRKEWENAVERAKLADRLQAASLEEAIREIERTAGDMEERVALLPEGSKSTVAASNREMAAGWLRDLETKKQELAAARDSLKAAQAEKPREEGTASEEVMLKNAREVREELLEAVRNLARENPETIREMIEALQLRVKVLEDQASHASPETANALKAIAAELAYEARQLEGEQETTVEFVAKPVDMAPPAELPEPVKSAEPPEAAQPAPPVSVAPGEAAQARQETQKLVEEGRERMRLFKEEKRALQGLDEKTAGDLLERVRVERKELANRLQAVASGVSDPIVELNRKSLEGVIFEYDLQEILLDKKLQSFGKSKKGESNEG